MVNTESLESLKKFKKSLFDLLDRGTSKVEAFHRSIVEVPINKLEELVPEEKRSLAEPVKKFHSETVESVYSLIRKVNSQMDRYADDLLKKVD